MYRYIKSDSEISYFALEAYENGNLLGYVTELRLGPPYTMNISNGLYHAVTYPTVRRANNAITKFYSLVDKMYIYINANIVYQGKNPYDTSKNTLDIDNFELKVVDISSDMNTLQNADSYGIGLYLDGEFEGYISALLTGRVRSISLNSQRPGRKFVYDTFKVAVRDIDNKFNHFDQVVTPQGTLYYDYNSGELQDDSGNSYTWEFEPIVL